RRRIVAGAAWLPLLPLYRYTIALFRLGGILEACAEPPAWRTQDPWKQTRAHAAALLARLLPGAAGASLTAGGASAGRPAAPPASDCPAPATLPARPVAPARRAGAGAGATPSPAPNRPAPPAVSPARRRATLRPHLTDEGLHARYRAYRDAREGRRWHALWLVSQGASARQAADAVGFHPSWVRTLIRRYNAAGPAGVIYGPRRAGRPTAARQPRGAMPPGVPDYQPDRPRPPRADEGPRLRVERRRRRPVSAGDVAATAHYGESVSPSGAAEGPGPASPSRASECDAMAG